MSIKLHATRFRFIALGNHMPGHWAYYDTADGADCPVMLGPVYRTKAEAIADMQRQADNRSWGVQ